MQLNHQLRYELREGGHFGGHIVIVGVPLSVISGVGSATIPNIPRMRLTRSLNRKSMTAGMSEAVKLLRV